VLSQAEVDDFMAAAKVVPGSHVMAWHQPVPSRSLWRGAVEVEAARVGEVILITNPAIARAWHFKLDYRGEEVYRIDCRSGRIRHTNPANRPNGFDPKVLDGVHEHVYVETLGCDCARGMPRLATSDHAAIFNEFCTRTHVLFQPTYRPPQAFHQLSML
jgi:hypothetical protein